MRRQTKSDRRLGLKKETLRTLNAHELLRAAGGTGNGTGDDNGDSGASSLSGSRKCAWTDTCINPLF